MVEKYTAGLKLPRFIPKGWTAPKIRPNEVESVNIQLCQGIFLRVHVLLGCVAGGNNLLDWTS